MGFMSNETIKGFLNSQTDSQGSIMYLYTPCFLILVASCSMLYLHPCCNFIRVAPLSSLHLDQGPTSTRYSNRTRIFLHYSNPTRKFLKNDRVASSMYSSHFRKIAALPCCSKDKVSLSEHQMPKAEQGMKLSLSNT